MNNKPSVVLLIDAGNTRAKFGWIDLGNDARESQALALDHSRIDDLAPRLEALDLRPTRILATNVAGPAIGQALDALCQRLFNLPVQWLDGRHGQDLLHNHYRNANSLGADRWMGLIGLLHRVREYADWTCGVPMLLATFGTATTLDTIALQIDEGQPRAHFLGGLILPGPMLMARMLAEHTAHLPFAQGEPTDYPIDTHNAISSGIAAAQAGALLRQWRNSLQIAPGSAARVFISGGGWPLVRPEVELGLARAQADLGLPPQAASHLANPVLDGLALLARGPGIPCQAG
uniref:type III pantothenate kinase n=1 Tax=Castellaniella defragrans TaxID=75697 RepID=UPI00333F2A66